MDIINFALLSSFPFLVASAPNLQDALMITPPPAGPTHCPSPNVLRRDLSCQYGQCGSICLEQGAFCCGPAGTLATSPYWMCDNGACVTSIRGSTGVVDCYDPDNPSGTTQSCIDHVATSVCNPTDRCYTCEVSSPYCQWETWIDTPSNSPTLKWFNCVETKGPDATYFASDITVPSKTPASANTSSPSSSSSSLPTSAIIGIAVGVGIALIGCVAFLAFCCLHRRRDRRSSPQELNADVQTNPKPPPPPPPPMAYQPPIELPSQHTDRDPSELGSTTAYSPHSQFSTPIQFAPPDNYAQNVEQVDMWRRAMNTKSPTYMESPATPARVYDDSQNPRDSWGRGDDAGHMNPPRRR